MLVRNIGAPRLVASPTHNFWSEEIDTGATVDVPDGLGVTLCEQVDVWQADADGTKSDAAAKASERAARKPGKDEATNDALVADKAGE